MDFPWYAAATDEEVERIVGAWVDAPTQNLETLGILLSVAADQVWSYAPESGTEEDPDPVPEVVPARLVLAQLYHATALWDAGRVSGDGTVGDSGFSYTPRPLDKTIRGIIRPRRGAPSV